MTKKTIAGTEAIGRVIVISVLGLVALAVILGLVGKIGGHLGAVVFPPEHNKFQSSSWPNDHLYEHTSYQWPPDHLGTVSSIWPSSGEHETHESESWGLPLPIPTTKPSDAPPREPHEPRLSKEWSDAGHTEFSSRFWPPNHATEHSREVYHDSFDSLLWPPSHWGPHSKTWGEGHIEYTSREWGPDHIATHSRIEDAAGASTVPTVTP